jgi:hypothetical protein
MEVTELKDEGEDEVEVAEEGKEGRDPATTILPTTSMVGPMCRERGRMME